MANTPVGRLNRRGQRRRDKREVTELDSDDRGDRDSKTRGKPEDRLTPGEEDKRAERWDDWGADPDDDWEDRNPPPVVEDEDDLEEPLKPGAGEAPHDRGRRTRDASRPCGVRRPSR
jgi:hypothetical protein